METEQPRSIPDIGKILLEAFSERPIAYYPIYAKVCNSVTAGILLSQLLYWNKKMVGVEFYKTDSELRDELYFGKYELDNAKEKLKALGFVSTIRKGVPAKTYYTINTDVLLYQITSYLETRQLDSWKPDNLSSGNQTTIYTENTQENTNIDFSPAGILDKSDKSVQKEIEGVEAGDSIPPTPPLTNKSNLKRSQLDVLKSIFYTKDVSLEPSVKKITGEDNVQVFNVFKSELYPHAKLTTPSIVEGIPRAISFFKTEFGGEGVQNLIKAIKAFKTSNKYVYMKNKDPLFLTPKVLLSLKFVEETLYPLSFNQQQSDGRLHNTAMSEEELREIEESDAESRRRFMARRSKSRTNTENRV